ACHAKHSFSRISNARFLGVMASAYRRPSITQSTLKCFTPAESTVYGGWHASRGGASMAGATIVCSASEPLVAAIGLVAGRRRGPFFGAGALDGAWSDSDAAASSE